MQISKSPGGKSTECGLSFKAYAECAFMNARNSYNALAFAQHALDVIDQNLDVG
jgi:hypothetical protein